MSLWLRRKQNPKPALSKALGCSATSRDHGLKQAVGGSITVGTGYVYHLWGAQFPMDGGGALMVAVASPSDVSDNSSSLGFIRSLFICI